MLRNYFGSFILGLLFSLGFAPNDLWPLSIISITCLFFFLKDKDKRNLFYLGFFFGLGTWLVGISWLYVSIHYYGNIDFLTSSLIILVFISILSLYNGITLWLYYYLRDDSIISSLFAFPIAWFVVELLRTILFTGFPWLVSGTMLANTLIDGWTPIIGAHGNTLLLLLISSSLYLLLTQIKELKPALLSVLLISILCISGFGFKRIEWTTLEGSFLASIYQTNLELSEKWSTKGIAITQRLMEEAVDNGIKGEVIVFPETALILSKKDNKDWINYIDTKAKLKGLTILTGIIEREGENKIRNRILGLGNAENHYDKVKLVPFGEFIPLEAISGKFLDILDLNLTNTVPGDEYSTIKAGNIRVSPSICYEIAFPSIINKTASQSNLMVTISNDTWFGRSYGPMQHLEIAQNRALEQQKSLIRSTNSGISAFIKNNGDIIEQQGHFEDKVLRKEMGLYKGQTFYAKFGNLPIIVFIILILLRIVFNKRNLLN